MSQEAVETQREQIADAFGRKTDPLEQYTDTFRQMEIDPFELYLEDVLSSRDLRPKTEEHYVTVIEQWREFMSDRDRHPACPNEQCVKEFAYQLQEERGNQMDTVEKKLLRLNKPYEYWQNDPAFPHPQDYNPFNLARSKLSIDRPDPKEPPRIPVRELADIIQEVNHIRQRLIIVLQLKLGLRASEVANLQLQDVNLGIADIRDCYPELGSHSMVEDRENAVYIAPKGERDRNKSGRPRVLPLDGETRRALVEYLLIRPDAGNPWVILSKTHHAKMENEGINRAWLDAFQPEYQETEQHRGVTSHYGRHRFTTYWQVEEEINRELVKYMRGDLARGAPLDDRSAMDEYIHTYYEDIESLYRNRIYKLNI